MLVPPAKPATNGARARVGVLLSGRGSNLLALHEATCATLPAEIAVVVSNVAAAPGLARAGELGLDVVALPHRGEPSRQAHEAKVRSALDARRVDWICLAGYMRLLSADFVAAYPERILNIHPSLLPAFPGLEAQCKALDYGVRVSGCTVHLVDAGLDSGPIVYQEAVAVDDDDTADSLAARILAAEHHAYPEALRRLLTEEWTVVGRRVRFGRR